MLLYESSIINLLLWLSLTKQCQYFRSAVEDLKTIKQIDRILQIWKEREIFGKDFIDKLQSYRPKGLRSESQSEDTTDGTLMSPTKKRIRSTSDSGNLIYLYFLNYMLYYLLTVTTMSPYIPNSFILQSSYKYLCFHVSRTY